MTSRYGSRPSQVRPRPPSTGRPAPVKVRPRAPAPGRLSTRRRVERRRSFPLLIRAAFAVAIVALGAGIFFAATGGLSRVMATIGTSVDGFLVNLAATPTPRPTTLVPADAPSIERPSEPYTNQPTVDLVVSLPSDVVADPDTRLRLYLSLPGQVSAPILEIGVGTASRLVIPDVELTEGANDFTATLVGPAGESEPSPLVTFVLDMTLPPISLTSPGDGATVNRVVVELVGKTQGRTTLVARNEANNATVTGLAASDGSFKLTLPIEAGTNGITITATDPAGNIGSTVVAVLRGSGALAARLTASAYRISVKSLPATLELDVLVTDPDGRPLEGADVTFILTVPGIQPLTGERQTGGDGRATFQTRIPKSATVGQGQISVLVSTSAFGSTTARTVLTLIK